MKKMKKLASILLAAIMVLAMAVPAMAANITISGSEGATFAAYRLLNATNSEADKTKYAYTVNETYLNALKNVTEKETEEDIIKYINDLAGDADKVSEFANKVYEQIKAMEPEATTTSNAFNDVAQGYYLIVETKPADAADTVSLVMLDTAGLDDVTVKTKEEKPTFEKKIKEKNDTTNYESGWQDGADYDLNDEVPFLLKGTVDGKYDSYETYKYVFHDKMSDGLTFTPSSVVVKVGTEEIKTGYRVEQNPSGDDCTFEIVFDNLKDIAQVKAGSTITVEFTAKLNERAVIGKAGNTNEGMLEYSNNPYDETTTGETPWDKVRAFTYKLTAHKVDGTTNEPLDGAGFTLFKKGLNGNYTQVGIEVTGGSGFTFERLDAGEYKLEETTVPAGYNKADDILFKIEATYDTESEDPQLSTLEIKDAEGNVISGGDDDATFTVKVDECAIDTTVANNSGTELPETGGIGTTIFYVLGSILVLGAVILLVTKKRMSTEK